MEIEKICKNCANYNYNDEDKKYECTDFVNDSSNCFNPKEYLVRLDEREKMIEKIEKFYHMARHQKFSNSMDFLELLLYLGNEEKEN